MTDLLSDHQRAVAERVLAQEEQHRRHLVVSLSGAHAYGFPSPDSDLDLKAVHVVPTAQLLGLRQSESTAARLEVIEGVEIDYTSNEIGPVLQGVLNGNGNYAERILGALRSLETPALDELRPLVQRALSRRLYHHYRGFAHNQLSGFLDAAEPTAKKALYVLRTALTGTHVLRTGELIVDVNLLLNRYGHADARELVAAKRAGERVTLEGSQRARWTGRLESALRELDRAFEESTLPEEAPSPDELDAWLVRYRLAAV